jgi:hypothetical protein
MQSLTVLRRNKLFYVRTFMVDRRANKIEHYDSPEYFHLCHSVSGVAFGKLDDSVLRPTRASMFWFYSILCVKLEAPIGDTRPHINYGPQRIIYTYMNIM